MKDTKIRIHDIKMIIPEQDILQFIHTEFYYKILVFIHLSLHQVVFVCF